MRERRGFGGGREGGFRSGGFRGGGFGRGPPRESKPKPIKEGEEYTVKITDVGAKGDGIAKIENFIVFVPGTKKGDEVKIRIKQVSERFAVAEKIGEKAEGDEDEPEEPVEPEEPSEGDWDESSEKSSEE